MGKNVTKEDREIGLRLSEFIRSFFKSRADFARTVKVNADQVAFYEAGERVPNGRILARFSAASRMNVTWLLTGEGEMLKPEGRILEPEELDPMAEIGEEVMGYRVRHKGKTYFMIPEPTTEIQATQGGADSGTDRDIDSNASEGQSEGPNPEVESTK